MEFPRRSTPRVAPAPAARGRDRGEPLAWLLWAYWTALALMACPYEDTVRDLVAALGIAAGVHFPATGPGLAFAAHLGPAWFYLLAPVVAVSRSWLGPALFIAALGGLKFPLAWRLGRRLGSPRFGLLFAFALLLPGWQHLQSLLPTHTSLVETTLLGALLLLIACLETPTPWRAFALGCGFALALHAHPTALVLLPLGVIGALRHGGRSLWRPACVTAALLGVALPFAPYLAAQAAAGWPDAAGSAGYIGQSLGVGQLAALPALADAVLWGGPHTLIDALVPKGARAALFALWVTVLAATAAAALAAWPRLAAPGRRLLAGAALGGFVTLCTLCILRERIPWYMAYAPTLACAALLAACWEAAAGALPRLAPAVALLALVTAGLGLALDAGLWRAGGRGEFLLPGGAMHDTLSGYAAAPPLPVVGGTSLPARFAAASGDFLCAHPDAVLHASYGGYVDGTAALDARLRCASGAALRVGAGAGIALERHWIGLPRRLWRALRREPELRIGPFGLARAGAVAADAMTLPVSDGARYPRRDAVPDGSGEFVARLELPARAPLVASVVLGPFSPVRIEAVSAGGHAQAALATTAFVTVYDCTSCTGAEPVRWEVRYRAARGDLVDLAGLAAGE